MGRMGDPGSTAVVEIACDESGFSGSNLLDPASPVIVHAGVDLTVPQATELMDDLRSRLGEGGSREPKSALLLRRGRQATLEWFLTALRGRTYLQVIDKRTYVAARVVELFVREPSYGDGTRLGADLREAAATIREHAGLLEAFVALVRTKRLRRVVDHTALDRFFAATPHRVPALQGMDRAHVEGVLERLIADDPAIPPPLEPLVPAVAETALFWSAGLRSVIVVHDEQSALTRPRMARLASYLADAVSPAPPPLLGVTHVDSRSDPRVQVADFLAGVARRAATRPAADPRWHELVAELLLDAGARQA